MVPWCHGAMKLKKGQVIPNPLIQPEIGSELSWLWRHGPGHSPDPLPWPQVPGRSSSARGVQLGFGVHKIWENLGDSDFQTLKTVDTIGIKTNNEASVFMNKWVSGWKDWSFQVWRQIHLLIPKDLTLYWGGKTVTHKKILGRSRIFKRGGVNRCQSESWFPLRLIHLTGDESEYCNKRHVFSDLFFCKFHKWTVAAGIAKPPTDRGGISEQLQRWDLLMDHGTNHGTQICDSKTKTRCSPRTRMQSRRTLLWNKLLSSYLNSFVHVSPVTVPVHCRLWNAEEVGVQSVGCGV